MRQFLFIVGLLVGLTVIGTVGLRWITAAPWFDCLYMAVITLTTVGYGESVPLGTGGRLFIIVYLIFSIGTFTYSAFQLGQWVVSIQIHQVFERRRMKKEISRLRGHYIVCGFGRMGQTICRYLHERNQPFVVIDSAPDLMEKAAADSGWNVVVGDATNDEVLRQAGIERARSLATVLSTDADNVYVVLSARMLATGLQIIARASDEKAVEKMQRAGATRVVSPFSTGAVKIARFMLTPTVEDFFEITDTREHGLELADVLITENSPYVGKRLMETDLRERGVMVVGIRRASGERLMPPPGTALLMPGDSLFAFGSSGAVNAMIGEGEPRS